MKHLKCKLTLQTSLPVDPIYARFDREQRREKQFTSNFGFVINMDFVSVIKAYYAC